MQLNQKVQDKNQLKELVNSSTLNDFTFVEKWLEISLDLKTYL